MLSAVAAGHGIEGEERKRERKSKGQESRGQWGGRREHGGELERQGGLTADFASGLPESVARSRLI